MPWIVPATTTGRRRRPVVVAGAVQGKAGKPGKAGKAGKAGKVGKPGKAGKTGPGQTKPRLGTTGKPAKQFRADNLPDFFFIFLGVPKMSRNCPPGPRGARGVFSGYCWPILGPCPRGGILFWALGPYFPPLWGPISPSVGSCAVGSTPGAKVL